MVQYSFTPSVTARARMVSVLLAGAVSLGGLAGCSESSTGPARSSAASAVSSSNAAVEARLEALGLQGKSTEQIIEALDRTQADKPSVLAGSVRQKELLLTAGDQQMSLPMPADKTYVAIAPFLEQTHECFNHNLATCQGEQPEQQFTVTITDADGKQVLRETGKTYANGFIGFWVPRDITGTLTVEGLNRKGSIPFGSGEKDPTCLTTLKLS